LRTPGDADENDEAAFKRETASCKGWWNEKENIDRGLAISKPASTQF
jgi:hypothetical protein